MRVRFWGTRGSIAAAGPETVRYGGNTACVEVRAANGAVFVLDCGTGARRLGENLAAARAQRVHLLIGHTHADHIQGLPFFLPRFVAGTRLTIYGPAGVDRDFPSAIGGQMDYAYFPVPLRDLPATVEFVDTLPPAESQRISVRRRRGASRSNVWAAAATNASRWGLSLALPA